MTDEELIARLRERGGRIPTAAADRIEALVKALREIDALDPESERIGAFSENAIRGLVLRVGEIARAALEGGAA